MLAVHAEGVLPFVDELENLGHGWRGEGGGSLGEAADEFVEEVFGADLEMEGVAAVLDEDVEQLRVPVSASGVAPGGERGDAVYV